MARLGATLLLTGFLGSLGFAVATTTSADSTEPPPTTVTVMRTRPARTVTVPGRYLDHSAGYWHWRYRHRTRQLQIARARTVRLHRTLLHRPAVVEAINLSCAVYGWCSTLWRKAECETGGTFSPTAQNPSGASGLFQFLPSTWATTPFARFSIWSPYANALAAGWMHKMGRGSEWTCR